MATKAVAKPLLRGLSKNEIKTNLAVAITLAIGTGIAWKILVCDRRKKAYAEFYKNYDSDADFERMKAAGIFSCV